MACACIGVYRKTRLDESYRAILRAYQMRLKEDTIWFSIELEWHIESTYTSYEILQLTAVFDGFPEQEILIFGECDRIFVAAYEIIKRFGGLLSVNIGDDIDEINSYPGRKIPVYKETNPKEDGPDYWLVDHIFIKDYFNRDSKYNFERFKLDPFLPKA